MSTEYGGDQIQILEGLEAVRKDRVCILEVRHPADFIISYMRLWITLWMRHLQDFARR